MPVEDRVRTYAAVVKQTGSHLRVTLGGADFYLHDGYGNYLDARFEPTYLFFAFGSPYYYTLAGPDIAEKLPSGRVLVVDGFVETARASNPDILAPLHGSITEFPLLPSGQLGSVPTAYCHSENHQFRLTPTSAMQRRRK